jgi:hypothetical protein
MRGNRTPTCTLVLVWDLRPWGLALLLPTTYYLRPSVTLGAGSRVQAVNRQS